MSRWFWTLIVVVPLLSMEGQKALGFHQKYLNVCSEDERRSYRFETTWGWVINDRVFILGWTIPLKRDWGLRLASSTLTLLSCSYNGHKQTHQSWYWSVNHARAARERALKNNNFQTDASARRSNGTQNANVKWIAISWRETGRASHR